MDLGVRPASDDADPDRLHERNAPSIAIEMQQQPTLHDRRDLRAELA
jgi:hypothetical protein